MVELRILVSEEVALRLKPIRHELPALLQQIAFSLPSETVPDNPVDDTDNTPPVYVEFLNFLVSRPPPETIQDFKVSAATQERLQELREKSDAATLSRSEQAELEAYAQVEHLMTLLKTHNATS
ncbi:MAG: hypothetical protein KA314_26210 [Chloroflexi bacterium]|nr:hypothetical protein [Chloroflexota bacterium]MBP8059344.1 hypothetical protein [Chloroflexota bacterium]